MRMRAIQLLMIMYNDRIAMIQLIGPVPEDQLLTTAGDLQIQGRGCWDAALPDGPIRVFQLHKVLHQHQANMTADAQAVIMQCLARQESHS